jgi:dihydroflavonol-4-reductase
VRGTVRSVLRAEDVRAVIAEHHGDTDRLEMVTADLRSDDGWSAAVRGCRYVLHVASPVPTGPPRSANDIIAPARDGALRVLSAAGRASVDGWC